MLDLALHFSNRASSPDDLASDFLELANRGPVLNQCLKIKNFRHQPFGQKGFAHALLLGQDADAIDQFPDLAFQYVDGLLDLTESTPMDDEQQKRFAVSFNGEETEILYHVWREQEDWVHLYFSSESEDLIAAIKVAMTPLARAGD